MRPVIPDNEIEIHTFVDGCDTAYEAALRLKFVHDRDFRSL